MARINELVLAIKPPHMSRCAVIGTPALQEILSDPSTSNYIFFSEPSEASSSLHLVERAGERPQSHPHGAGRKTSCQCKVFLYTGMSHKVKWADASAQPFHNPSIPLLVRHGEFSRVSWS